MIAVARALSLLALVLLPGCVGSVTAFAAIAFGVSVGAWLVGRSRQQLALGEVQAMRLAIASGQHRPFEEGLRKELALVEAGEAVGVEREWLARAQLGALMLAEWRFDEARELYEKDIERLPPRLRAMATFCRDEVRVLSESITEEHLLAVRGDRDRTLATLPTHWREDFERAWTALEGVALVRLGRAREAVPLLEKGIQAMNLNPARVVYLFHLGQAYEHIGERRLAAERYAETMDAFPGTRLASEAKARSMALGAGAGGGFREMLPEAPAQSPVHGSSDGAESPGSVDSGDS